MFRTEKLKSSPLLALYAIVAAFFLFWLFLMPEGVDGYHYAFMAKRLAWGGRLHHEIPTEHNSLLFYVMAAFFRVFPEHPAFALRAFYVLSFACVWLCFYASLAARTESPRTRAAQSGILAFAAYNPLLLCDPGRNFLPHALGALILSISMLLRGSYFAAGATLALGYSLREPFVLFIVPFLASIILQERKQSLPHLWRACLGLVFGFIPMALVFWKLDLLPAYLEDLRWGAKFRSASTFGERILGGLSVLGLYHEVKLALLGAITVPLASLLMRKNFSGRQLTENSILVLFWVMAFFEIFALNKTGNYHLITLGVLSSYFLVIGTLRPPRIDPLSKKIRTVMKAFVGTWSFVSIACLMGLCLTSLKSSALKWHVRAERDNNFNPYRILKILERIDFKTFMTFGEYGPFVLMPVPFDRSYLDLDLEGPAKYGRADLIEQQLQNIERNPPEVFVLKTTNETKAPNDWHYYGSYMPYTDRFGGIIEKHYVSLGDFSREARWLGVHFHHWHLNRVLFRKDRIAALPDGPSFETKVGSADVELQAPKGPGAEIWTFRTKDKPACLGDIMAEAGAHFSQYLPQYSREATFSVLATPGRNVILRRRHAACSGEIVVQTSVKLTPH